jgi:hypothetical protein
VQNGAVNHVYPAPFDYGHVHSLPFVPPSHQQHGHVQSHKNGNGNGIQQVGGDIDDSGIGMEMMG